MQHSIPFSKMLRSQGVGRKAQVERNRLIRRVVVLLVVMTLSALFCVWSRVKIVQTGYVISDLQDKAADYAIEVNHLKLEVERLKSPGHLQKVATQYLGMHPPTTDEIIFVNK